VSATVIGAFKFADFVADQLADGQKFRALTMVDIFTALAIAVGARLRGEDVVAYHHKMRTDFSRSGSRRTTVTWKPSTGRCATNA